MAFNWFKKKISPDPDEEIKNRPDYSEIDSIEKAIELYKNRELTKIYLMPLEFGGEDSPMNLLYVPEIVQTFKQRFDAMVEGLLIDGKKISYSANPEYKGKSFIPSKVIISVSGEAEFIETINIW